MGQIICTVKETVPMMERSLMDMSMDGLFIM